MPFQRKKRLYRYAYKNCGELGDGTNPSPSKNGFSFENFTDEVYADEKCLQSKRERSRSPVHPPYTTSVMTNFATTAANIFRKFCCNGIVSQSQMSPEMQHYFDILMQKLKKPQKDLLYLVVKSHAKKPATDQQMSDCILIERSTDLDKEIHVITYRLFFCKELKTASQLKCFPNCRTKEDPKSICCNPQHWARILETDIAPPPYQRLTTESEDSAFRENSQEEENSVTKTIENSSLTNIEMLGNIRVRKPESLTTDGESWRSDSKSWCTVAYWELTQRVGEFYFAKKPILYICLNSANCSGEMSEEVILHKLFDTRKTPSPINVAHIRPKIGLGIALSQESNCVWLFNRSMVPIFVHSPTLCASWFQVCKVMPGGCLRAFDYQKARELKDHSQLPGVQTGPVDKYSMRISFVKGYGTTYTRRDVTQCPCWLELHFTKR